MRCCPVCGLHVNETLWRSYFLVPDGWTRPEYLDWKHCECGMIYGDNPQASQEDYDTYYLERYGYGVNDYEQGKRMMDRAHYIAEKYKDKNIKIVDFGGGDGGLSSVLERFGFKNAKNVGAGDEMPEGVDVVLAEHVLEHIYDMDDAMRGIQRALNVWGTLIVDVPDAAMVFDPSPKMPILDFSQVHINHFRTVDMLKMMDRYGFEMVETSAYTERNTLCRMYVFTHNSGIIADKSKSIVTNAIEERVKILKALGDQPVIVWGCGDIALACLAKVDMNIQYFVDNDPAFRDATINNIPVLEAPISGEPIIVLAQSQKGILLDKIRGLGLDNQVIVI